MRNSAEAPTSAASSGRGALLGCLLAAWVAVLASALVVALRGVEFDAAPIPDDYTHDHAISVPAHHGCILGASARIGEGLLPGPEDLAYDAGTGLLYSGCEDGWIRRVKLQEEGDSTEEEVEEWAHVDGGRPLGLAFGPARQLVVADAYKGLLTVAEDGAVRLLADRAEGLPFALTDGVDVAADGTVYFTDASHKYNLSVHMLDILEGRPHGRLLRFDPVTNTTTVLLRGLHFANGVAVFPDQASLVFCESPLRRCRRYHIAGEKRGKGRLSYVMTLVWTAVTWQVASVGVVGLIFEVSSLFSNVISTLALPVVPVFAVAFFGDKMNGEKVMAMLLGIWGFASYIYQHYLDDKMLKKAVRDDAEAPAPAP